MRDDGGAADDDDDGDGDGNDDNDNDDDDDANDDDGRDDDDDGDDFGIVFRAGVAVEMYLDRCPDCEPRDHRRRQCKVH